MLIIRRYTDGDDEFREALLYEGNTYLGLVKLVDMRDGSAALGFEFPPGVKILRAELVEQDAKKHLAKGKEQSNA